MNASARVTTMRPRLRHESERATAKSERIGRSLFMNERKSLLRSLSLVPASAITLCSVALLGTAGALAMAADQSVDWRGHGHDHGKTSFATRSSPIAITPDDKFVWSVNPDTDSVSVFLVAKDANKKVAEIPVGKEPWCVAIKSEDDNDDHDHG